MSEKKSCYKLKDGFDWRALDKKNKARTVGQLVKLLQQLPDNLPFYGPGVQVNWYNVGAKKNGDDGTPEGVTVEEADL